MNIRKTISQWLLKPEVDRLRSLTQEAVDNFRIMPYLAAREPQALIEQLSEADPRLVDMLIRQLRDYDTIAGGGVSEQIRVQAVQECRSLYLNDPMTQFAVELWTDYAFGQSPSLTADDPQAQEAWDTFWESDANAVMFGERRLHKLSEDELNDGELFFVFLASTIDGETTCRTVPTEQIKEIVKDPDDSKTVLYYRRDFTQGDSGAFNSIYYPDWAATEDQLARAKLPPDAVRADSARTGTDVVMLQAAFREVGGRGWPLATASIDWTRAYKGFLQDRAAVAKAAAAIVEKYKVKGGQRAVDAMRRALGTSLTGGSGDAFETNPPPVAGSGWLENEAVDRQWMNRPTNSADAEKDGAALKKQAALGYKLYPHFLGDGDVFRLATACYSDDTEYLNESGEWKLHKDWLPGEKVASYNPETQAIEYIEPLQLFHYSDLNRPMIHIAGRSVDLLVTDNHRMLILNENNVSKIWAKKEYEVREAGSLPSRFALPTHVFSGGEAPKEFTLPGYTTERGREYPDKVMLIEDWLEFLGWFVTEGSLEKQGESGYTVTITQAENSPHVNEIRCLTNRLPFGFSESMMNREPNPKLRWRCHSKPLYEYLEQNCGMGCVNKHLPDFVLNLTPSLSSFILKALWNGDGNWDGRDNVFVGAFTTTSPKLADQVQSLIIRSGDWATKRLQRAENAKEDCTYSSPCWWVYWTTGLKRSLSRRLNVKTEDYQGDVWCFDLPKNHFYITRRNGCAAIAGNTAMEGPTLKSFNRYQSFWSSVWKDMFKIVCAFAEEYGNKTFSNLDVEVSSSRVITLSVDEIGKVMTFTNDMLDRGIIDTATAFEIDRSLLRSGMDTLGIDSGTVLDDAEVPPEPEPAPPPVIVQQAPPAVPPAIPPEPPPDQTSQTDQTQEAGVTSKHPFEEAADSVDRYRTSLRGPVYGLWTGQLSRDDFTEQMEIAIDVGLRRAWKEGMADLGLQPEDMTEEENLKISEIVLEQFNHIDGFGDVIEAGSKANGGKLDALQYRLSLWVNQYNAVRNQAKLAAASDPPLTWVLGPTEEHCSSCGWAAGKTYRASIWQKYNFTPQSRGLDCGGWNCKCFLSPGDEFTKLTKGHPRRLDEE